MRCFEKEIQMKTEWKMHQPNAFELDAINLLDHLTRDGHFVLASPELNDAVVAFHDFANKRVQTVYSSDRNLVEKIYARDWVKQIKQGNLMRYEMTPKGYQALERMRNNPPSYERVELASQDIDKLPMRYVAETPIQILARKYDKNGFRYLNNRQIAASERLREDYEVAQISAQITQDWHEQIAQYAQEFRDGETPSTQQLARQHWAMAMSDLGPGLADISYLVCCLQEGLESAEKLLGWPARSGKIVLRIGLMRLAEFYDIPDIKSEN